MIVDNHEHSTGSVSKYTRHGIARRDRLPANPLGTGRRPKVRRQKVTKDDRRRKRRAATADELAALLATPIAVKRGRHHPGELRRHARAPCRRDGAR